MAVHFSLLYGIHNVMLMFQGFDEYMNLVLDEAEEVHMKQGTRKNLGK